MSDDTTPGEIPAAHDDLATLDTPSLATLIREAIAGSEGYATSGQRPMQPIEGHRTIEGALGLC